MNAQSRPGAERRARVAGALLGVHAGDSLGATVEFLSWAEVRATCPDGVREIVGGGPVRWAAGHATDDTDVTRAVLLAYLDRLVDPGLDVVRRAADHMIEWLDGHWSDRAPGVAPRDVGAATLAGLERYRACDDPRRAGAGPERAGNGSLMRCIATALAVPDRGQQVAESTAISAITHDDPRCTVACAAYVEMVAALLSGRACADCVDVGVEAAGQLGSADVVAAIRYGARLPLAEAAISGETHLPDDGGGFVLDSLSIGVAALVDPRPFAEALVDVVRLGGDTDTNAAIAGGLLGARDGHPAIPPEWVSRLQFGTEFLAAALVLEPS